MGNVSNGSEITTSTTRLTFGGSVNRYPNGSTTCTGGSSGSFTYTQAAAADTNGNCEVEYNSSNGVSDY